MYHSPIKNRKHITILSRPTKTPQSPKESRTALIYLPNRSPLMLTELITNPPTPNCHYAASWTHGSTTSTNCPAPHPPPKISANPYVAISASNMATSAPNVTVTIIVPTARALTTQPWTAKGKTTPAASHVAKTRTTSVMQATAQYTRRNVNPSVSDTPKTQGHLTPPLTTQKYIRIN